MPRQNDYAPPAETLARSLALFFELSAALSLSDAENRALLDLPASTVAALRARSETGDVDPMKLLRRLEYAIPILQRMIVSMAS